MARVFLLDPGPELHIVNGARALPPSILRFAARAHRTGIRANLKRDATLVRLARGLAAGEHCVEHSLFRACLTGAVFRCANLVSAIAATLAGGVEA